MKVVSVCSSDWANFAYNFSESLKAVGVDSYSYCLHSHPFGYPKQSTIVPASQLKDLTSDADFIVIHHSCAELLPYVSNKKIIHYAAGTKYRQEYQSLNLAFSNAVTTFIALPEFQYLVPNTKGWLHYVVGAVDTDYLQPEFGQHNIIRVAHYPSNPEVKGTNKIVESLSGVPVNFVYSTDRVSWTRQIERIKACDIYIELFAPTQGGKPYGSFGITALEAAALGKVVVTQNLNSNDLYFNTYGGTPIEMVSSDLRKVVYSYVGRTDDYVVNMQKLTRDWVVKNHSYKATGERVLSILNGL